MIDPIELAYLAGILDVSGYVGVLHRKDRDKNMLMLNISRDEPTIPHLFAKAFGGAVGFVMVGGKPRHVWVKRGKRAQVVLRELLPYLHIKRLQVEKLCELKIANRGAQPYLPAPGVWNQLEAT